jgi:hypothetical protein
MNFERGNIKGSLRIGKYKTVHPGDVIEVYTKHKTHLFKKYGPSIKVIT